MKRILILLVLCISQPLLAVTIPASTMAKWNVKDIVLCATNAYPDWQAYQFVRVTATFNGPNATTLSVNGFWDGKGIAPCASTAQVFRVRFTPHLQGTWTFSIANNVNDPGLTVTPAEAGPITVNGPVASPAGKVPRGFLRRDVAAGSPVATYMWGTGERAFLWGQTYYQIVNREVAGQTSTWQTAVTQSTGYGINKVRFLISPWTSEGGGIDSQPYKQTSGVMNRDQLNVPHWQALDRIVKYLNERNIVAEIVIFRDGTVKPLLGTPVQDCRYLRYAVSRYAAYPNVTWSLTNEWESAYPNAQYWSDLGCAVRGCPQTTCTGSDFTTPADPWLSAGGKQRVLTIHPAQTDPDSDEFQFCFDFATAPWPSAASLQSHKRNEDVDDPWDPPYAGDRRGYESIACNQTGSTDCTLPPSPLPVSNDEYGYIGNVGQTRDEHRNVIWGIATGGGYGTAGDARGPTPPIRYTTWMSATEYEDISRLVSFFTSPANAIEYWKMGPQTACRAATRAHTLAEPGRQYVTYTADGAAFQVTNLVLGRYQRTWFNPRDGSSTSACVNITSNSFSNGAGDWVLLLKKTATCF